MYNFSNIYWNKEAELIHLTQTELNEKIDYYKKNGFCPRSKSVRNEWLEDGAYTVDLFGYNVVLYCREDGKLKRYCAPIDGDKIQDRKQGIGGTYAFKLISKIFKEYHGVSLIEAFGRCPIILKKMVPAPLLWLNPEYRYKICTNVYKADVSSAFGYELSKPLPDYHTATMRTGKFEPTKEYPFAFYTKSGNIAIYGEFDTSNNEKLPVHDERKKYIHIPPEQEQTILMKAAQYDFYGICRQFYNERKQHPENKLLINSFIGFLQSTLLWKGGLFMGHITAVVIARCNQRMIRYCERLHDMGRKILLVMTDSIMWSGGEFSATEKEKRLGAFYEEYANVVAIYYSYGQYAIAKDKKFYVVKHQGIDGKRVDVANVKSIKDLDELFLKKNKAFGYNKKNQRLEEMNICPGE